MSTNRRPAQQPRGTRPERSQGRKMRLVATIFAVLLVIALVLSIVLPFLADSGGGTGF